MPPTARQEITALRLAAQRIATSEFRSPGEVVHWLLAMQAQDYPGAKWSIGLRLPGSTDAAIEDAIARRELVRSWPMRGTLHFLPGEDLGWMLQLTTTRLLRESDRRRADLELTDAQLGTARDTAIAALQGGKVLERSALLAEFERAGVSTASQRGYHTLWYLAQTGVLVFGPASGKQQTFALLDEWVESPRRLEREEALGEVAQRYFCSHGPATDRDLARWASLTLTEARAGIAVARDQLQQREFDGVDHYFAPGLQPALRAGVFALPGFDEYMLGYADRSAGLAKELDSKIVPGRNGMFLSTIVVDGQVAGTWRRTARAREVVVEPDWFSPPTEKARKGFARAVSGYGTFLGMPVRIAE